MDSKNELIRQALKEYEVLSALQESRRKERGLEYYIPNPMQLKAHSSKADLVLFCGGNRSGKSHFGAAELAMHLTRQYPDWYPENRRFYKPIKAVVVSQEAQTIEKIIEPKIRLFLNDSKVARWKRVTGGYLNRIDMKDGGSADFLTNEQDDMAFEGHDWDFFWGDEPQRERKFQAIMRGLVDRNGKGVITFTPLIEPWMKEKLVDKADGKRIDVITSDIRDNKFDIKGNKILTEESIIRFEESLPDDVRETRIHGNFFHLRGRVYPEFCEVHKLEFSYQYPDPVIAVLDPHDRQPHHVIWAIVDRGDDLYVHSELTIHCTVEELVGRMRKIESDNGYKMKRRLIDPNFGRKPLITTGRNMIEELYSCGMGGWCEADDPKEEGHMKVKDYLHFDKSQKISFTNKPKLFFHKTRCPVTIRSINNYQYEEWVGKIAGEKDPKEKAKDKETHGADCVRYLCMSNPKWSRNLVESQELTESPY
jgi:hypothetical protein